MWFTSLTLLHAHTYTRTHTHTHTHTHMHRHTQAAEPCSFSYDPALMLIQKYSRTTLLNKKETDGLTNVGSTVQILWNEQMHDVLSLVIRFKHDNVFGNPASLIWYSSTSLLCAVSSTLLWEILVTRLWTATSLLYLFLLIDRKGEIYLHNACVHVLVDIWTW